MTQRDAVSGGSHLERLLKEATTELQTQVEQGDLSEAVNLLQRINEERSRLLYLEVGRLTRGLHDAINNFHIDAGLNARASEEMSQMADATERLNYVIRMTQDAANKTMDKVEESAPVAELIGAQAAALRKDWARLVRREMKPEEFRDLYRRIDEFLKHTEDHADVLSRNLGEIMLAQDYQDLTGQVVKRVISLVKEIEENLVNLVCMAGQVDRITGIKHSAGGQIPVEDVQHEEHPVPEGPIVNPEQRADVVSGQDEVDELLSSLGF